MTCLRPGCGLNIERERRIDAGPFSYDADVSGFDIEGRRITCRPLVREVLVG